MRVRFWAVLLTAFFCLGCQTIPILPFTPPLVTIRIEFLNQERTEYNGDRAIEAQARESGLERQLKEAIEKTKQKGDDRP